MNRAAYITIQDYTDYEEYKKLEDKFSKVYRYSHKIKVYRYSHKIPLLDYEALQTIESQDTLKNIMYKHSEKYINQVEIIEEVL